MRCSRCGHEDAVEGGKWGENCREGRRKYRQFGSALYKKKENKGKRTNTSNGRLRLLETIISTSPYSSCQCCGESSFAMLLVCDEEYRGVGDNETLRLIKKENLPINVLCANCERAIRFHYKCVSKAGHKL